jgi:hypothetical protein
MAASAWVIYNSFKRYMADGTMDLDGDTFRMGLYTSASNAATATISIRSSITNEVANGNGYVTGGKTLAGRTWSTGASASEMRFDATATIWSASGGNIANIRYAVIYDESTGTSAGDRKVVCYSALSTAQFTVTDGNTLTITPSANGIFELN